MSDRLNRTSICSVVFLDIIDYSVKPDSEQIDIKDCFNHLVGTAIKDIAESDRIILDTGDGAAIAILGAPEEAMFVSLTIRNGILQYNQQHEKQLYVRLGINLGPVRVVVDINGQPNIIGDGINVAQRVMSFSEPNQILVSRSYYEFTSRLTPEIMEMFAYSGVKQDKHVREHEVYSIRDTPDEVQAKALLPVYVADKRVSKFRTAALFNSWTIAVAYILLMAGLQPTFPKQTQTQYLITDIEPGATTAAQAGQMVNLKMEPLTAMELPISSQVSNIEPVIVDVPVKRNSAKKKVEPRLVEHEAVLVKVESPEDSPREELPARSAWQEFKQSVRQGKTVKECTQAEISLNQCR